MQFVMNYLKFLWIMRCNKDLCILIFHLVLCVLAIDPGLAIYIKHRYTTRLEDEGLLPHPTLVGWRPPGDEQMPNPMSHECMLFTSFLERGLSVPVSPFVRQLLHWYDIKLHHLTPCDIL